MKLVEEGTRPRRHWQQRQLGAHRLADVTLVSSQLVRLAVGKRRELDGLNRGGELGRAEGDRAAALGRVDEVARVRPRLVELHAVVALDDELVPGFESGPLLPLITKRSTK